MKKNHLKKYVKEMVKRGYTEDFVMEHLKTYGYDPEFLDNTFIALHRRSAAYYASAIILIFAFGFLLLQFLNITGYASFDPQGSFEGLLWSDADYDGELIYQGLAADGTEKIIGANVQGKQKGSLNIIDYDNDGRADLFTTGYYTQDGQQVISTNLYRDKSEDTGSFIDVKDSSSCWGDFDNNGYFEPAIMGGSSSNLEFKIFKNDQGTFAEQQNFDGFKDGAIECFDYDNDGWTDIVVSGFNSQGAGLKTYRNNNGNLELDQDFTGVKNSDININDFNNDERIDFIVSGRRQGEEETILYTNNGGSFSEQVILSGISYPSIDSADYDNDGDVDIFISGNNGGEVNAYILENNGGFTSSPAPITPLRWGALLITDNPFGIFVSGQKQDNDFHAEFNVITPDSTHENPSAPTNLNYEGGDRLKLTWDGDTVFFKLKAGTIGEENMYVSGFNKLSNNFKLLNDPGQCFSFQVKSVDNSLAESDWSDSFSVNCNTEVNDTVEINETVNETINETVETDTWFVDRKFGDMDYHAEYNKESAYVKVTESLTNTGERILSEITIFHPERFKILRYGSYKEKGNDIEMWIPVMFPNQKFDTELILEKDIEKGQVLATQVNSVIFELPEVQPIKEVSEEIDVEDNITTITIDIELNDTVLIAEDVTIKQTIPKCLLEKISELIARSNRKFTIINEDPVIMWHFDSVVDPEELKLEIDAVADENCTNEISTEIIAKKYLIEKDELNILNAIVLLVTIILLTIPVYFFVKNAKIHHRRVALVLFAAVFILLNLLDALSLLPESLDFVKKFLSWVLMISLLFHVSLKETLFTGEKKNSGFFNVLLLLAFVMLSVKNIVYIAFKTYGTELLFSDLLLPIIKFAEIWETWLFFSGMIIILILTLYVALSSELKSPSFAALIHKTEYEFIGHPLKKPLYVFLILMGFYIAIFNFLFGWFSIAFDGPFLILSIILIVYAYAKRHKKERLEELSEKPDTFIEKFIKLFTNERNFFIALSALPLLIFVVETYNYLVYFLFTIRSIYFESISMEMPTITSLNLPGMMLPLYLVQIFGLISAIMLAFLFWWHFFLKREPSGIFTDKPKHPLLFSVFVTGFIAYLIKPVFDISTLKNSTLSGVLLVLKEVSDVHLLIIYAVLALFFVSFYLIFRDSKKSNLVAYAVMLFTVLVINLVFLLSFYNSLSFTFSGEWMNIINQIILVGMSALYIFILLLSIYALLGEFLALARDELHSSKIYRRLMLAIFSHKVKIPKEQEISIKGYMEKMLDEGEEDYLIMEHIHEKTHIPMKEIAKLLKEVEEDDERKEHYHQIHHYHHNIEHIKKLHKIIKKMYYQQMLEAEIIIKKCISQGWTQDDIAAAMMHLRYKKRDRVLFQAMRRVYL